MNYDLFFYYQDNSLRISLKQFQNYFRKKPNYKVEENAAIYNNEDTGIYLIFEYNSDTSHEETPQPEGIQIQSITFSLNYYRPHIFGLEAEKELTAFIHDFHLLVSDSQIGGMGNGQYSPSGFLNGWNKGNEFALKSISRENKESLFFLPTQKIEQYWNWNYNRNTFHKELNIDIFVPKFMFIIHEGEISPVIVWSDGIPVSLPDVQKIVIYRDELAPRKLFSRKPDMSIIKKSDLEPLLTKYQVKERFSTPYHILNYEIENRPIEIVNFIRSLSASRGELVPISVDKILNEELVGKK